jgi:transposase
MRFVALKSEAQQARAMLFRTRQMFIGQRTQTINATATSIRGLRSSIAISQLLCGVPKRSTA